MQIKEIFKKEIYRPINGVVKADQLNESVVWQELEEYVLTRELDLHFRKFLSSYLSVIDNPHDLTLSGRIGIWVSGFFGSGKSHFIKILSYLLANRKTIKPETNNEKQAIDFFTEKIKDAMLLGDLKRVTSSDTDVILFNIDSKADSTDGRSTILSVFWRVLNQSQGFCGESLHLAEIERYLYKKGKFDEFRKKFAEIYGSDWEAERDAYTLIQDEIVEALSIVLEKSKQAANDWFEKSEKDFNLTVENFAKRVKEYLDSKSKFHRIVFLVDEIGQFIGSDTHLMLNLQTIVEDLGRMCNGRAWVIVTSQEDIDAVIGEVKGSKANDFSKIQGRFNTRLSLSSSNTDEVIQVRLLEKNDHAKNKLEKLFAEKGDIIKNQLSFSYDSSTLKNYSSSLDFIHNYPFIPYHFQLIQKIFESIRKAGATGLHLSRGERSMLDAFQSAAINISSKEIGALVPLYEFFPCIESFLDTAVKRSIDQARGNKSLELPFDVMILQTLFLIRYVDILKPNIDNLVTLCISEVDTDRIILKLNIEASLERLEKQSLINRNGDLYFFLTNEEREVSREIKGVEILSSSEVELLSEMIFEDVLKKKNKHRYIPYKRDYQFNRICDGRYLGKEQKDDLCLEIISPLHDDYTSFIPAKCIMYSSNHESHIIVKLPDDSNLISEIRTYLQTQKYIKDKSDAAASANLKTILRDRAEQNRERRTRLLSLIEKLIVDAAYYTLGKSIQIKAQNSSKAIDDAFDYLIENTFRKFGYLVKIYDDPIEEIRQTLKADDIAIQKQISEFANQEPQDIKEVKNYIDLRLLRDPYVILNELVQYFAKKPYGWGEFQTIVLIAKLFISSSISLIMDSAKLLPKDAVAPLSKTQQWKNIKLIKRKIPSEADIKKAQAICKELFGSIPPDGQDKLSQYIQDKLGEWVKTLDAFKPLADTGKYPGKKEIDLCLQTISKIMSIHDSYEQIKAFIEKKGEIEDASDDINDLKDFYNNQRQTWEILREAMGKFESNLTALEKNSDASKAFKRMKQILCAHNPYGMLKEVNGLISCVQEINDALIREQCESAIKDVDEKINAISDILNDTKAKDDVKKQKLIPLQNIKKRIQTEYSIPHISYCVKEAQEIYENMLEEIEDAFKPKTSDGKEPQLKKQVKTIKLASLKQKAYIDTEDDVENYIKKLKNELLEAIRNNNRIKII
ncbi:MAG: BREX system P-loop protein BrxC [Desulfobacterales bacterium]|nr:BREX system P-loop protein BrxC [Desulfobacterales bacterium]MBF0397926.1 BREX system P-loop protein BrxC [Desulfobacterales bacterium]